MSELLKILLAGIQGLILALLISPVIALIFEFLLRIL